MKNTQSQIKPIMQGKKPGTTYCVCKDYTDDFRKKLNCIVCRSSKSRFLK